MSKKLLSAFADTRKYTVIHDNNIMETRQDCEPIVEFVKHRAQMPTDKDFKYMGEIPLAVLGQALREGWADDDKRWRKWFAENPAFTAKYHQ